MFFLYSFIFAVLGSAYGAILYGMLPQIIGDLPRGNQDIDPSYIVIRSEYNELSQVIGSSGFAITVFSLYPLVSSAAYSARHFNNAVFLLIVFVLIFAVFAFALFKIMLQRFPRFEVDKHCTPDTPYWCISEVIAVSIKRRSFALAAYIMYLVLFLVVCAILRSW